MKAKAFIILCLYAIVFACIGYATMSITGAMIDRGGLWFVVAVLALSDVIGVGYWAASLLDPVKYPKLPKIVNLVIFALSAIFVLWSAIELFIQGSIILPSIMVALSIIGVVFMLYQARVRRMQTRLNHINH